MCHTRLGGGSGGGIRWSYTIFRLTYSGVPGKRFEQKKTHFYDKESVLI